MAGSAALYASYRSVVPGPFADCVASCDEGVLLAIVGVTLLATSCVVLSELHCLWMCEFLGVDLGDGLFARIVVAPFVSSFVTSSAEF